MGTDIEIYVEALNSDGSWYIMNTRDNRDGNGFWPWKPDIERNLHIFQFLAGRGGPKESCPPIAAGRGLPDDVSAEVARLLGPCPPRELGDSWGHSWVEARELIAYAYLTKLPGSKKTVADYLRHTGFFPLLDVLRILERHYTLRLVFAFNN